MTAEENKEEMPVPKQRRRYQGVVLSDHRDKTVKVAIQRLVKDPRYGKYLRRHTVVHAHDEDNEAKVDDVVELVQCRPVSKTKTWRLVRVVSRAGGDGTAGAQAVNSVETTA